MKFSKIEAMRERKLVGWIASTGSLYLKTPKGDYLLLSEGGSMYMTNHFDPKTDKCTPIYEGDTITVTF